MYLVRTPFFLPFLYPSALFRVSTSKKEIFLSFDDGPTADITPKVLAILDEFNAKAIFFCIGSKAMEHPEILEEIISRGHRIGNHSWSHPDGWKTNCNEYLADIKMAAMELEKITATKNLPFRPPYGHISQKLMRHLKVNQQVVMWDVMPGDFDENKSVEKCARVGTAECRPGSIVVFHDSEKAGERLLEILPTFLRNLQQKNYSFPLLP